MLVCVSVPPLSSCSSTTVMPFTVVVTVPSACRAAVPGTGVEMPRFLTNARTASSLVAAISASF